jgi:hypothetical protein
MLEEYICRPEQAEEAKRTRLLVGDVGRVRRYEGRVDDKIEWGQAYKRRTRQSGEIGQKHSTAATYDIAYLFCAQHIQFILLHAPKVAEKQRWKEKRTTNI